MQRIFRGECLAGFAAVMIVSFVFLVMPLRHADAAPAGTLTGAVQSITVGSTTAISTLTFTDVDPSEVTAANDLRIRIPSTVNALWDPTDATATIGGTASTSTNVTVTFESGNKVLVIDATERFSPLGTLTIAGLSIIGINYETAAVALDFSIDAGVSYGAANANTAITVTPATLTSTNVEPASLVAGRLNTVTVSFTQTTSTPANGLIQTTFPSGFILTSVGATDGACSTMDGTFATAVVGQVVTITRTGVTTEPAGAQTCTIANVINPGVGTAGVYAIETQTSTGATRTIEVNAAVGADTFTAGSVATADVQPASLVRGVIGSVFVTFTTASTIPVGGKIVVTFPIGFSLTSGSVVGSCTSMDGTFATSISGQSVTITRSGGSVQVAAAENCTITNVGNPSSSGDAGTYQIKTTTAADVKIEENTSVASDSFQAAGGSADTTPPGPVTGVTVRQDSAGPSVILAWTNPTDSDLAGVRVLRSLVSGVVDTTLTQTLAGTYTDSGLTVGTTYYYRLRPVDLSGNERSETTEYPITILAQAPAASEPESELSTPLEETPSTPTLLPGGLATGDLVRGSAPTVYFVSADGKRHLFPNEMIYRSWYSDFAGVKRVGDDILAALPLGKSMTVHPGTQLVKIVSDPKVYAVEPGGVLRWITSEAVASQLYGPAWAERVRDIDVSLFVNYTMGDDVLGTAVPAGTVAADGVGAYWWIVREAAGLVRRHASAEALTLNRFSTLQAVGALVTPPSDGSDITGFEAGLALPIF